MEFFLQVKAFGELPFKPCKSGGKWCIHIMLLIGGRDMNAGAVSVRLHGKGPQGARSKGEVLAEVLVVIKEQRS